MTKKNASTVEIKVEFVKQLKKQEFPTDMGLDELAKYEQVSPNTVIKAIQSLSYRKSTGKLVPFDDTVNSLAAITKCQIETEKDEDTKYEPKQFPWELQRFIDFLIASRKKGRNYKGNAVRGLTGDELSEALLYFIAENIDNSSKEAVSSDYRDLILMQNTAIQNILLHYYDKEIRERVDRLYDVLNRNSTNLSIEYVQVLCRKLDEALIAADETQAEQSKMEPYHKVIEQLCQELISVRQSANSERNSRFKFKYTEKGESRKSLDRLQTLLHKKESWNVDEVRSAYNRYLLDYFSETRPDKHHRFEEQFFDLKHYYFQCLTADLLQDKLKDEMCTFLKDQFESLECLNLVPYPYDPGPSQNAELAAGRELLQSYKYRILAFLHKPFHYLRISFVLIKMLTNNPAYFGIGRQIQVLELYAGINKHLLNDLLHTLATMRKDINTWSCLIEDDQFFPNVRTRMQSLMSSHIDEIWEEYRQRVPDVSTSREDFEDFFCERGEFSSRTQLARNAFRLITLCKICASYLAEESVKQVMEKLNRLKNIKNPSGGQK